MTSRRAAGCALLIVLAILADNGRVGASPIFQVSFSTIALTEQGERAAVGDLNHDDIPDVVAVSLDAHVHVLDGLGGGLFAAPESYDGDTYGGEVLSNGRSVAISDLNRDGHPDVVQSDTRLVYVMLGDGHGALDSPAAVDMGYNAFHVVADDFNQDGVGDLLVVNEGDSTISVRIGRGDGVSFDDRRVFSAGGRLGQRAVIDMNGDGILDVVVAQFFDDYVSIFLGDGHGGFAAAPRIVEESVLGFEAVTAGDLDDDGEPDLVLTRRTSSYDGGEQMLIRRGLGNGQFAPPVTYAADYGDLTIIDFDGDGRKDIVAASSPLRVYPGHGDGTVGTPRLVETGTNGYSPSFIDLDGDGRLDVVSAGGTGVRIALSGPGGSFSTVPRVTVPKYTFRVSLADMDEDGRPEIVAASVHGDSATSFYVIPGPGSESSGATWVQAFPPGFRDVVVGDWDGDGNADAALQTRFSGPATIYRGNGSGVLLEESTLMLGGSLVARDLNGDGRTDFIYTSGPEPSISIVLHSDSNDWLAPVAYPSPAAQSLFALGDIDRDSVLDMVIAPRAAGPGFIYRGLGDGRFARSGEFVTEGETERLTMGDIDGDHRPDMVVSSIFDGLGVYPGLSDGGFGPRQLYETPDFINNLQAVDLNGDGRADVLGDLSIGDKALWMGQADGTLRAPDLIGTGSGSAAIGDMDADGRLDLVAPDGRSVALHRNIGMPVANIEHLSATGDGWGVRVSWSVADPRPEMRFHLRRRQVQTGEVIRLTAAPIASAAAMSVLDPSVDRAGSYEYLVVQVDPDGQELVTNAIKINFQPPLASSRIVLASPNPFRDATTIQFELLASGPATTDFYNVAGRLVRRLPLGFQIAGRGSAAWDGRDNSGRPCPSGVYFARVMGGDESARITILR